MSTALSNGTAAGSPYGAILGIIPDGYTVHGYIAEVPRLYPALRFTYRPVLTQHRAIIFREIAKANDPNKEETIAAQAIARSVTGWDMKDAKGESVSLSTSSILRVQPKLLGRLFRIAMGDEAPDEDPNISATERDEKAGSDLAAALAGITPEEADAKN